MCGIAGWTNLPNLAADALVPALDKMTHRGPDDHGQMHCAQATLGMRRLAIIDLAGGRQPIHSEDHQVSVVCNGEIYNYIELRQQLARGHQFRSQSDTEVLAHLYEDEGTEMFSHLNGMFAFAIWDERRQQLILARDRFGKKPLYYLPLDEGLIFASELKALVRLANAAGYQLEVRPQSVYDYLSLGTVPQPYTIYENVRMLPPASYLLFTRGRFDIRTYWQLDFSRKVQLDYQSALERARELVKEAVRIRLHSDVPLGVFLSGGVDSTVVAYEASQQLDRPLRTFTVGTSDKQLDERPVAERTARHLGTDHTTLQLDVTPLDDLTYLVRHFDQPFADPSAIPTIAISRLAQQHVTVILNGDGGDEVFAGYRRYQAAKLLGRLNWIPRGLSGLAARALSTGSHRRSRLGFAARFFRGLAARRQPGLSYLICTSDMLQESDKQHAWQGERMRATEDWIESQLPTGLSALDTQLSGDIKINLLSGLLVKMDMGTMSASLEGRSPLLDHRIAEFTATLDGKHRLHRGLKSILRDAYRGRIPNEVVDAPKRGFEIPLAEWLRTELRDILWDSLSDPNAQILQYLERSFVLGLLEERILTERNWTYIVYALLVLELWLQEFLSHG